MYEVDISLKESNVKDPDLLLFWLEIEKMSRKLEINCIKKNIILNDITKK